MNLQPIEFYCQITIGLKLGQVITFYLIFYRLVVDPAQ